MSKQDNVVFNTLERAVSDDFNNLQSFTNRTIAELCKSLTRQHEYGILPSLSQREQVASGLILQVSAGTLQLTPGMLLQNTSALGPAAGGLDSDFYVGFSLSIENQADPWDGTNAWWLLEASVDRNVTLNEARDIFNPATLTFAPAAVNKWQESQITVAWKKGTATTIANPDAGYAPIGAVYRPAVFAAITSADIVNLVIQIDDLVPSISDDYISKRSGKRSRNNGASGLNFLWTGETMGARVMAVAETASTVIRDAAYVDPTHIAQIGNDGYWWYIYLALGANDTLPTNQYGATVDNKGVIVASRTPPTSYGKNSVALTIPNPVGGTVAIGEGVLVGLFRASGVGANIHTIDIADNGEGVVDEKEFEEAAGGFPMNQGNTFQAGNHDLATTGLGGTEDVPLGCHLKCFCEIVVLDTTAVGVGALVTWAFPSSDTRQIMCSFRNIHRYEFELFPRVEVVNGTRVTVAATAVNANLGALAWNAANVANNAFRAGIWGIRI